MLLIRNLYQLTAQKHIEIDTLLHLEKPKQPKDCLVNKTVEKVLSDMNVLKEQNTIMNQVAQECSVSAISQWQTVCEKLPANIFVFVRKAIILQLANNTNLFRWKKIQSNLCGLCVNNKQTQLHMFNNCSFSLNGGRYTWRHDSILFTICHYLKLLENMGFELFADLDGFRNPAEFFNGPRPDILLKIGNELTAIELSCCYENNFTKAHEYKIKRYENLKDSLVNKEHVLSKLFVEISSLGFFPRRIKRLSKFLQTFCSDQYYTNDA